MNVSYWIVFLSPPSSSPCLFSPPFYCLSSFMISIWPCVSASEFYCSICGTSIVKLYVFFSVSFYFYYDSVSFTCVAHSNMVGNCMWRRVQNSEKLFILIFVTFFSLNFIISYLWSHLQSPALLLSVSVSQIHFGISQQNVNIKDPSLNSSSSTSSNCGAACSR